MIFTGFLTLYSWPFVSRYPEGVIGFHFYYFYCVVTLQILVHYLVSRSLRKND